MLRVFFAFYVALVFFFGCAEDQEPDPCPGILQRCTGEHYDCDSGCGEVARTAELDARASAGSEAENCSRSCGITNGGQLCVSACVDSARVYERLGEKLSAVDRQFQICLKDGCDSDLKTCRGDCGY